MKLPKLPKCLREEIKAMLKQLGFSKPHVSDEVLINCWDMWRDRIKKKYPHENMPVYGRTPKTKLSRRNYNEQTVLCSAGDLHKMMDDIDDRLIEFTMFGGGHRDDEE